MGRLYLDGVGVQFVTKPCCEKAGRVDEVYLTAVLPILRVAGVSDIVDGEIVACRS